MAMTLKEAKTFVRNAYWADGSPVLVRRARRDSYDGSAIVEVEELDGTRYNVSVSRSGMIF